MNSPANEPPVPPPSDWLAKVLFEIKGTLGAIDERTKQQSTRCDTIDAHLTRIEERMRSDFRWIVGLLVAALVGIAVRR